MKKIIFVSFFIFFFASVYSQGITIDGKNYTVDTLLYQMQIGPGVYHSSYRLPEYPLNFQVMEVDLKNPYNMIETVKAGDKAVAQERPTSMARRKDRPGHEVVGGTNGDFYFYQDVIENGIPRSGQFLNGEMIANPTGRASFILGKNKKPYVDRINFRADLISGEDKTRIHTVNMLRLEWEPNATDFLTLYTDKFGTYTSAIPEGTKVVIRPKDGGRLQVGANDTITCIVESVKDNTGATPIPAGKAVLHGRDGASAFLKGLTVGSEVTMAFRTQLRTTPNELLDFKEQVGGSDCIVLKYGQPQHEAKTAASGKHPRTGMGFSQDSTRVFMVVADGRSGASARLDLLPFGELFKAVGAWNAVNLDGGGSSVMFVNNQKIVNSPSGVTERAVGNGVLVISTAPEDAEVNYIKPHKPKLQLPKYGEHIPQFYAYNQYGKLLDDDLQGVVLTCPKSLGEIVGNKFIANGTESGQITATYNGTAIAKMDVILLPVSGMRTRLDSVLVDNRRDYLVEIIASTSAGESLISPVAFDWIADDESIASVESGVVKGVKNGSTVVTGTINDISDDIKIIVQNPPAPQIIGDSLITSDWKLTASSFLGAKLNTENLPQEWDTGSAVNFVYSIGRAPFITLTNEKTFYGLPDTVKLVMNIGDMGISKAIFTLRDNLDNKVILDLTSFKQNADFSLDIPIDQYFDVNDRAIYPIKFDNVKFYLDAADMVAAKPYTLAIKEITLCYKDCVVNHLPTLKTNLFKVYPNPMSENNLLTIQLNEATNKYKDLKILLYDLTGKQIYAESFEKINSNAVQLPIKVKSGTYLLELKADNQSQTVKLIVK